MQIRVRLAEQEEERIKLPPFPPAQPTGKKPTATPPEKERDGGDKEKKTRKKETARRKPRPTSRD